LRERFLRPCPPGGGPAYSRLPSICGVSLFRVPFRVILGKLEKPLTRFFSWLPDLSLLSLVYAEHLFPHLGGPLISSSPLYLVSDEHSLIQLPLLASAKATFRRLLRLYWRSRRIRSPTSFSFSNSWQVFSLLSSRFRFCRSSGF